MMRPKPDVELDERTCRLICPVATAMVGAWLTGIGTLQMVAGVGGQATLADDMLSADAPPFLIAMHPSSLAPRPNPPRLHHLQRLAATVFNTAKMLITASCFVITNAIHPKI